MMRLLVTMVVFGFVLFTIGTLTIFSAKLGIIALLVALFTLICTTK